MSSLLSSANIITHFPVIGEQEKSVSVLSWRDELELESGIEDLRILCGTLLFVSRFSTLSSQSSPKTQLRALGELGVRYIREFYALGQRPKISSEIYSY